MRGGGAVAAAGAGRCVRTTRDDYGEHGKRTYRQGQAFMEAMDVAHFGINTGTQPVRLIAVYMGAQGAEDVISVK